LSGFGVKRISVGGSLARAAYGALFHAAEEMRNAGSFSFAEQAVPHAKINKLFKG
jgi:2-methylisocitrate lyase-like PEP mutase family enzyme